MKKYSVLLAGAANVAPLALCCFYACGAPLLFVIFPVIHILLFVLNNKTACNWFQVAGLGVIHITSTIATHLLYGWLYFQYVVDDTVGRMISILGCAVGATFTLILLIASIVMFHKKQKGGKCI